MKDENRGIIYPTDKIWPNNDGIDGGFGGG